MTVTDNNTALGSARRVADYTKGRGDAAVYKLTPPYVETPWSIDGDAATVQHEFVMVSAIDLDYGGFGSGLGLRESETMIFPSDGEGVSSWGELCMVERKSHADALEELGYEVTE